MNFVGSKGTDKLESFQNKSNLEFVKNVRILKQNNQNNYTQHSNRRDSVPSTSQSRSSFSDSQSSYQRDSPRFVERRSCFECGEYGHIVRYCPHLRNVKSRMTVPRENSYPKRPMFQKQDPRVLKEREKKQLQKNKRVIEKVLKPEFVQVETKPVNAKSINSNTGKRQTIWKPKPVTSSGGAPQVLFPNHQVIEITFLDDQGRPKTIKAWVPISN